MLIGPPVHQIQLFQKLTLTIQGQGHGWDQSSKSPCESNMVPCQSALPFMIQHFQNLTLKIQGQSHSSRSQSRYNTLSTHIPFGSMLIGPPIPGIQLIISKFEVENSRSRSWVRSKLKVTIWVQHSVNSHPFHSMSIGHHIPELHLFQNLTLKINRQGHGWGDSSKSQCGSNILSTHIPFSFHADWPSHSWDTAFSKVKLENPGSRSNDHDVAQLQV